MNRRQRRAAGQRGSTIVERPPYPIFLTERIAVVRQADYSAVGRPVAVAVNNDVETVELVRLLRQVADFFDEQKGSEDPTLSEQGSA